MLSLKKLRENLTQKFKLNNIETCDLEWIIANVLKIKRSEIQIERKLTINEFLKIKRLSKKRLKHIPLSQVLKNVDFYGLEFFVNKNVLSPRPETEILVEEVLKDNLGKSGLDIGTGSGAIAITLNKFGGCKMTAVEKSSKAIKVAKRNAKMLKSNVKIKYSDLFSNVSEKFDFIVSNPPYIESGEINSLEFEVKSNEPRMALDGGDDGLDFYRKITEFAPKYLNKNGKLFFELGIGQAEKVKEIMSKDFECIKVIKDYSKIDRIICGTKKD